MTSKETSGPAVPQLAYKDGPPSPTLIPDIPDELYTALRSHLNGMLRVVVQRHTHGQAYKGLGQFNVHGSFGHRPDISVEDMAVAVMAIAQEDFEEIDRPTRYCAQIYVQKDKTGHPKRPRTHFQLGGSSTDPEVMSVPSSEGQSEQYHRHNEELHKIVVTLAKEMATVGVEANRTIGHIFEMQRDAADARREADREQNEFRSMMFDQQGKNERFDRGMKLIEELVDKGMGEAVVEGVREKLGLGSGSKKSQVSQLSDSKDDDSSKPPVPSWAAKALPTPQEKKSESADAPSEPITVEVVEMTEDKKLPRHTRKARALFRSITTEQWTAFEGILSDPQLEALRGFETSRTDKESTVLMRTLQDGGDPSQLQSIIAHLSGEQMSTMMTLSRLVK